MTSYLLHRNVLIPMTDGVRLSADLWLPAAPGRAPVLLQRLPYDKSSSFMTQHIIGLEIARALDAGFGVVVQDTRGRYTSEGEFDPFIHEASDGRDTIAWIRAQPFSTGDVFTYGASYLGATQMLAATTAPEGLRGIAPQLTTSEYRENWTYRGGALQLGFLLTWIAESLAPSDLVRRDAVDPGAQALLGELLADPYSAMRHLPIRRPELLHLAPYVSAWLESLDGAGYWDRIDPSRAYERMDVAGLHIGGWNDIFIEGTIRNYSGLSRLAPTEASRRNQFLVIGPWSHGNLTGWQGDGWHGTASDSSAVDLTAMHLAFFSALADGRDPDLPKAHIFFSGSNQWHRFPSWPPQSTQEVLEIEGADSRLVPEAHEPGVLEFTADPLRPVPTVGGRTFLPGLTMSKNSGPKDQSSIEARDDVLVVTSKVLESDLCLAGEVILVLSASSTATDCDWTARLADVDPHGRSLGVVDGIIRARFRDGVDAVPLTPGRRETYRITLGSLAHVFQRGHRLRLQIASSNFPRFDRNPQCMVDPVDASAADFVIARQSVHTGPGATRLLLPVLRIQQSTE